MTIDDEILDVIKDITRDNPFIECTTAGFTGKTCKYCKARFGETDTGMIAEEHPTTCLYRRAIRIARKRGLLTHAD